MIRGAAVIMSDLWENQILIECWKPPPELVSVRLQLECELGLEQTCHILNLLRLRDAVLDWRCTMLLETYKRLRDSTKAMSSAMKELDEFNSSSLKSEATKNGWCTVATVLDENEVHAYVVDILNYVTQMCEDENSNTNAQIQVRAKNQERVQLCGVSREILQACSGKGNTQKDSVDS